MTWSRLYLSLIATAGLDLLIFIFPICSLAAENDLLESLSRIFLFRELMILHSIVHIWACFEWGERHWGLGDWNMMFFLMSDEKTMQFIMNLLTKCGFSMDLCA